MRQVLTVVLLLGACAGQGPAPIADDQVPQRTQSFRNKRVSASRLELKPGETTPLHVHAQDTVVVFVSDGPTEQRVEGQPAAKDMVHAGLTRFRSGPFTHAVRNDAKTPLRAVVLAFSERQGRSEKPAKPKRSRYCNPGSKTACVEEKGLFCTAKVCLEDVTIAPGAVTTRHSHATDHMLVAVSDYELSDEVEGKGRMGRSRKSGEVEYIPAGITHQLTNTGKAPARFIVILWR